MKTILPWNDECVFSTYRSEILKNWDAAPKEFTTNKAVHRQSLRKFVASIPCVTLPNGKTVTLLQIVCAVSGVSLPACFKGAAEVEFVADRFAETFPQFFPAAERKVSKPASRKDIDLSDILAGI